MMEGGCRWKRVRSDRLEGGRHGDATSVEETMGCVGCRILPTPEIVNVGRSA